MTDEKPGLDEYGLNKQDIEHGPVCKYCLRDYDARGHDHNNAIPRPQ